MYDLLISLYANDGFRFALWHLLDLLHLSGIVLHAIIAAGGQVFEDFSIVFP